MDAFALPSRNNADGQGAEPRGNENSESEVKAKKELVLNKFEYEDPDGDGIFTATIISPPVEGKYEIKTVIDYKAPAQTQKQKEVRMIMVVDPEGYIFEKLGDLETRIRGAVATLFWLNPETSQYEVWPADEFQQENPQVTDNTGKYSFLVPEGFYYLRAQAKDYITFIGEAFEVTEGSGVHTNIELKIANWWQRVFTVERVLLGVIALLLMAVIAALAYLIFKKRR